MKVGCPAAIGKLWLLVNEHMEFLYAEEDKMKPEWWVSCRPDSEDIERVRRGHTVLEWNSVA